MYQLTAFHFLFLPLLGFMVGAVGSLIGVGGGFILVPVLLVLFPQASPATITSISLLVVLVNAASGTLGYSRERRIDMRTGWLLIATGVPAAMGGALVTGLVSREHFELIFGLAMVFGAVYIFWRSKMKQNAALPSPQTHNRLIRDRKGATYAFHVNQPLAALLSPVAGFVSSFLGVGGGIIELPGMVLVLRIPPRVAVATSLFVVVFTALSAVLVHAAAGQFHEGWRRAGLVAMGGLVGAQLGVYLANRVNPRVILLILSLGLAAAGIRQVLVSIA